MTEHNQPQKANSLQEIIAFVESLDISKYGAWFRGHSDSAFELLPSVFRKTGKNQDGPYYNENELLREFLRRHPTAKKEHSNTLELLTYAQHYGLPTRLLDWSENILVATYFACQDDEKDGEIFILESNVSAVDIPSLIFSDANKEIIDRCIEELSIFPAITKIQKSHDERSLLQENTFINETPLNKFSTENILETFRSRCQINISFKYEEWEMNHSGSFYTYRPPLINERLIAQNGCFTVHAGKVSQGNINVPFLPLKANETSRLTSVLIEKSYKQNILNTLRMCGVDKSRLFPELEHQTATIKELCKY